MLTPIFFVLVTLIWVIRFYTFLLWGRLILDWILVFAPDFRPKGAVLIVTEVVFTLTDPPLKFFSKIIPPVRVGQIALNVSWLLTMLGCWIVVNLLSILANSL